MVAPWSTARLFAFRFGVIAGALSMVSHGWPLWLVPGSGPVQVALYEAWHWLATKLAALVGIELWPLLFTGSGDQLFHYVQFAIVVIAGVLGAAVWTALSRRTAHVRLAAIAIVVLRYYLATVLLGYGMAKVIPMQFPPLLLARYDQTLGDMSPMGLLWSFMGHSQAYTWFAGFAEVTGSLLLLGRRTYMIGAFVLLAVMTNIVLLNFCYDVPVKLFSLQLTALLFVLIAPQARRLIAAMLGRATPEVPPRVRGSLTYERVRLAVKLVVLALIALRAYEYFAFGDELRGMRRPTALHGVWRAERVVIDGVEHPPLFTDDARWRKLIFHERGLSVRFATDRRQWLPVDVDDKAHTITVRRGMLSQVWRYERPDPEHLIVDAPHVHAELVLEPPPPLATRGFHWVQEEPYNR